MSKYYYLIAGLPEIQPDETKLSLKLQELQQTLLETLTKKDRELTGLIFQQYEAKTGLHSLKTEMRNCIPWELLQMKILKRWCLFLRRSKTPRFLWFHLIFLLLLTRIGKINHYLIIFHGTIKLWPCSISRLRSAITGL